jgi:hypothetical protein
MTTTIGTWLATTWEGSIVKIALGAALGALASWIATADVHPLIVAITAAVVPVLINALNRQDPRYGRSAMPRLQDVATAPEFPVEGETDRA